MDKPASITTRTTHYIPYFTVRRGRDQVAVCGAAIRPRDHHAEPSCPACQAWLEQDAVDTRSTAQALETEFPEYRGRLVDPLDEGDRDGGQLEDADAGAMGRWAERYEELNGAPENEGDR